MLPYENMEKHFAITRMEHGRKLKVENGKRVDETVEYQLDSAENKFYFIYGQYDNDLETGLWSWQDTFG